MSNGKGAGAANVAGAGVAKRERFGSRLGFILISAGCAIGLGNVWRFPYITGEYGGAAFVLMYLVFLVILGLPVMVMEFAVGRASQKSSAAAFDTLQPSRKWHWFSWWGYIGCMVLMMFYTTVGGWMLSFVVKMGTGAFNGLDSAGVGAVFNDMLANPTELVGWMLVVIVLGFLVCSLGLQKGVERITKVMMIDRGEPLGAQVPAHRPAGGLQDGRHLGVGGMRCPLRGTSSDVSAWRVCDRPVVSTDRSFSSATAMM